MTTSNDQSNSVTYGSVSVVSNTIDTTRAPTQVQDTKFGTKATDGVLAGNKHPPYLSGGFKSDILEYLSRPTPITHGIVNPGAYGVLDSFSLSAAYGLFGTYNPFTDNLNGAIGARFTACFRIEFSATPQDAGIFKIAVQPMATNPGYNSPIDFVTAYATLPSSEVNLADTNTAVLKYPFLWSADYLAFDDTSTYGTFGVGAYTPFQAGTGTAITYTVYAWLEDLEIIGPGVVSTTTVTPQMGTGEEFQVAGPVSSVMRLGKTITDKLGMYIPKLSTYTRPLGWVFQGIGTLASQFGFSMPNDGSTSTMMPTVGRCLNNVNGVEHAQDLGAYSNNEIAVLPNFAAKDYDEMSLQALTSIPTPIAQFPLLVSDTAQNFKWTCQVSPACLWYQSASTGFVQQSNASPTTGGFLPSGILSVAQFFSYWRGDITFRFKFARSKFMGGKILIGYNPKPDSGPAAVPSSTRYDFRSCLVDLRNESCCDLVVPYTYWTDMCPTGVGTHIGGEMTATRNNGNVFMQIIDPLVVAGATASKCYVEVEVFTNEGFVFGGLNNTCFGAVPQNSTLIAQMGDEHSEALERTIGEAVLSLKQVAGRPTWHQRNFTGQTVLSATAPLNPVLAQNVGTSPAILWQGPTSNLNQIAQWFLFYRGSLVHKLVPLSKGTSPESYTSAALLTLGSNSISAPISVENRCTNIIRVPFYNAHNRSVNGHINNSVIPTNPYSTSFNLSNTDGACFYTAVPGDDFQLGGFVWFPPLAVVVTSNNFTTPPFLGA